MRRTFFLLATAALLVSAAGLPASAGKKPVKTTLYLHGNHYMGDGLEIVANATEGAVMEMDATEPAAGAPKSMSYSFAAGNEECTGNPLFPSWNGILVGKVKGDLKVIVHTVAAPSTVNVRIWTDIPFSSCTSSNTGATAFVPPIAEQSVDIPAGHNEVEILFEKLNLNIKNNMIIEFHQSSPTNVGRLIYDSPDFASRLEFNCIPASGRSCTP